MPDYCDTCPPLPSPPPVSGFYFGEHGKRLCACTTTYALCGHRTLGERPGECRCGCEDKGVRDRFVIDWCDLCQEPSLQGGKKDVARSWGARRGSA